MWYTWSSGSCCQAPIRALKPEQNRNTIGITLTCSTAYASPFILELIDFAAHLVAQEGNTVRVQYYGNKPSQNITRFLTGHSTPLFAAEALCEIAKRTFSAQSAYLGNSMPIFRSAYPLWATLLNPAFVLRYWLWFSCESEDQLQRGASSLFRNGTILGNACVYSHCFTSYAANALLLVLSLSERVSDARTYTHIYTMHVAIRFTHSWIDSHPQILSPWNNQHYRAYPARNSYKLRAPK